MQVCGSNGATMGGYSKRLHGWTGAVAAQARTGTKRRDFSERTEVADMLRPYAASFQLRILELLEDPEMRELSR
jgi:hypothetical protein